MAQRRILVTAALPYANGPIHLGHLVEYIQTDIWVRFQKLRGHRCLYMCADDTHGTAIMIRARQERRSEEELIAEMQQAHLRDFTAFDIEFDNYGSTNSDENRRLCCEIWQGLRERNLIVEREVAQLYDPEAGTFLADRFVKGTCPNPKCGAAGQYGDNCDRCGATYRATDLIDPVSTLSGAKPELRSERHLFVQLDKLHSFLDDWVQTGDHLQAEVTNYLKGHFLHEPLRDWDVSRPAPYFGFEIPDSPGNYWYVWFDAPIGYMASTQQWCDRHGEEFDHWWRSDSVEIHHFIGKDITYFHTLFWPGMLSSAGFSLPTKVRIHGFLTVGGEKMSKSKGTFVTAATYLRHLSPAYLRYYYASKLGARLEDIDLNLDEFVAKANADLVGKVVNLASRCAALCACHGVVGHLSRRWWSVSTSCGGRRRDRDRVRRRGLRSGHAIDDGTGGPRESVRRIGGALEVGQRPRARQRTPGCMHHRPELVPPIGRLLGPGPATPGQSNRRTAWSAHPALG